MILKTAIVLFNLGGPDSKESIRPFLQNFFTDPNIIALPYPLRWMVAKLISIRRSRREAGTSYGFLGDRSPLLANSQAQALALETCLAEMGDSSTTYKSFICMRYWHPMADEVARAVKEWSPDHIILLPLYPQFSTTTTYSSMQVWQKACKKLGLAAPSSLICCYPADKGFIRSCAANIGEVYKKAELETGMRPRILFSAHGLPEKIIKAGDPYQWQCEQSAAAIVSETGIDNPDWQVCYQSRVGPLKWIGPSTEEALEQAAHDNVPVVILPHAFTQEHVETLVEIELEYREKAEHLHIPGFYRVPTPGVHPDFIRGLADMVLARAGSTDYASNEGYCICPAESQRCAMRIIPNPNQACCGAGCGCA